MSLLYDAAKCTLPGGGLVDYCYAYDENGEPYRHEFLALHSERPVSEHLYSNGMYGMPQAESATPGDWIFDTFDWPEGGLIAYMSSWTSERCRSVSEMPYAATINGGLVTIHFGPNGGGSEFDPVSIPGFLQGRPS